MEWRGTAWFGSSGRSALRPRLLALGLLAFGCLAPGLLDPATLAAQSAETIDAQEEERMLREAAAYEWRGSTDQAEEVLTGLLERWPASSGGLFALERILRSRSRIALVLPWADRYLEVEPNSSGVRYMKLRVLVEVDSLSALDEAAEAWFDSQRGSADPYREVARLYARAFDDRRALEILERGRRALRGDAAQSALIAMEMGDLLARLDEGEAAIAAWSDGVRGGEGERELTFPRLDRIAAEDPLRLDPLLDALMAEPSTPEKRRTAVRLALSLGRAERTRTLTESAMRTLDAGERVALLAEVAQRADEAEEPEIRLWALREQRSRTQGRDARSLDVRIASAALAVGDTAAALEARTRLARSLPAGSDERRRVIADLIRVEAERASPRTLLDRLRGFEMEYPEAVELDELAARVAGAVAARGEGESALAVLEGRTGPRARLERAYLHLDAEEIEEGRAALDAALPALAPSTATGVIQLLDLLGSLGERAAGEVARWSAVAHWGDVARAGRSAGEIVHELPEEDRSAVLAQSARWLEEAGLDEEAGALWAGLVSTHLESPEHAEAIYRLARIQSRRADGLSEARALLQQLIVEKPESAIVPAARRELQRIGRGSE